MWAFKYMDAYKKIITKINEIRSSWNINYT